MTHELQALRFSLALLLLHALFGCTDNGTLPRTLALTDCRLPGVAEHVRCGVLEVPENRGAESSRKVRLHVAVIPSQGDRAEPDAIFLLAGGPGQGASDAFGPAIPALRHLNDTRDLVLVDQRGTGRSGALGCPADPGDAAAIFDPDQISKSSERCLSALQPDLSGYSTEASADDLNDTRIALGYPRINLIGGSYGTRLALVYARRHPEAVRSLVLDGAVPTDMALPLSFARDTDQSLSRLFSDCRGEPACAKAFGNLEADFDRVRKELLRAPKNVTLAHPRTGKPLSLRLTHDVFAGLVRALLYAPELSALLPLAIREAASGDHSKLIASAVVLLEASERMLSFGLFLSIVCSEDLSRISEADIIRETSGTLLGDRPVRELAKACAAWPKHKVSEGFFAPVQSSAPALVLSGDLDPATPPRFGESVVRHLTRGRHVVVRGASHGTLTRGRVPELVERFVEQASAEAVDLGKMDEHRRPPFFIDSAGPAH